MQIRLETRNILRRSISTYRSSSTHTRNTLALSLRLPIRLRQRVRSPDFVFLGHLGVDRRRLDVAVAELFLHEFQVRSTRPIQKSRERVPKAVGGISRI